MALDLACNLLGDRAVVKRVGPFLGDTFEYIGQRRVFNRVPVAFGLPSALRKYAAMSGDWLM